ncbi:MAG: alkaline phosphatase D family protein [Sedimentisphaerales bacterium]|nr:alkaline phosphatase D family protein [Sedimentisphaerales bacterium]
MIEYKSCSNKIHLGIEFRVSIFIILTVFLSGLDLHAAEQYKKLARDAVSDIVDGKYDAAIEHFEGYLSEHPNDLESMYGLAVVYAQKQEIGRAVAYVQKAVDEGLPFARFLAGPRDLLRPLTGSTDFKVLAEKYAVELLHGPMLGCVTESSAKFWVRTANEVPVEIVVRVAGTDDSFRRKANGKTSSKRDYTAVLAVEDLKPGTLYEYELRIDGNKEAGGGRFRTFGPSGRSAQFQVGFGGGAGFTPEHERMWNTIYSHNLPAFLLLGDNVYIDNPTRPAVQQYCYYRRQSRPEFRKLVASASIFAIWDDHDFTTDDAGGGPEIYTPEWKIPVWRTFTYNWNNPYYAGGEKQPGCWFDFSISDVDFFMLDGRYYRDDPKSDNPSMLGQVQKKWLFEKLKSSKATFKVLASPVPWALGAKPGSSDPWQGYRQEREQIFSFLETNKIDGVILISADRHRSDAWKIERENGYDLYEFESSKLTNIHTHKIMPGAIFGYNKKCSFGLLTFDTTRSDPEVTYQIISIDNELIWEFSLKKSQLTHSKTE